MRIENWLLSNMDDSQKKVFACDIDEDIIVTGPAGSGKTNLALYRAKLAKESGDTYAIIVLTVTLRRMIAYGMKKLGLDIDRVAYSWEYSSRGFQLTGDVYWKKDDNSKIYLVDGDRARLFRRVSINYYGETRSLYGIDFSSWVDFKYYTNFGRRSSWFQPMGNISFVVNNLAYELIPNAVLYKPVEDKIDHIIVDEGQDFLAGFTSDASFYEKILKQKKKSLSIFGDKNQTLVRGNDWDFLALAYNLPARNPDLSIFQGENGERFQKFGQFQRFELKHNYRLPKSIAKAIQSCVNKHNLKIDLLSGSLKDGGDSDYPKYPKPLISKYSDREGELEGVINRIQAEDLDDVAIILCNEETVVFVNNYLNNLGIATQTRYATGSVAPFDTIDTIDFSNNDLPCILTCFQAKGCEFDNVFIPFANDYDAYNALSLRKFYVATTRSSHSLYISYSGDQPDLIKDIDEQFIDVSDWTMSK